MTAELIPDALRQAAIGDGSFLAGTPIAVPSGDGAPGEKLVESLVRGDRVLTLGGPVAVRHVAGRRIAAAPTGPDTPLRPRVIPVRVAAGAFGDGQPVADLLLPPEQLMHVLDAALPDGALVPLGALVNGTTIRREPQIAPSDWVRLELEQPGVVIAAGLLVAARLDPSFPPPADILPAGPAMAALRDRLAAGGAVMSAAAVPDPVFVIPPAEMPSVDVAADDGGAPDEDPEAAASPEPPAPVAESGDAAPDGLPMPALQVLVEDQPLAPLEASTELVWRFMVPGSVGQVRLISPRGIQPGTALADRARARRYGVAVRMIMLDGEKLELDGPAIGEGFHDREVMGSAVWRWTKGDAVLNLPPGDAPRRLMLDIFDWHRMLLPE